MNSTASVTESTILSKNSLRSSCTNCISLVRNILEYALCEGQHHQLSVPLHSLRKHFEQIVTQCQLLKALCESAKEPSDLSRPKTLANLKALAPEVEKNFYAVWDMMLESESIMRSMKQYPDFQGKPEALQEMIDHIKSRNTTSTFAIGSSVNSTYRPALPIARPNQEDHENQIRPPDHNDPQNHKDSFLAKLWIGFIKCGKLLIQLLTIGMVQYK